ncbi:DEAD/DEAH box helicase [Aquibacillus rhizosphaerae]|uniref:DEAD/DEAH box helicase n=1 Tax=Aquibacillus rhizosphaerae TaxID=3051431 RepID=A0ABT7LCC5_9BACI|nr:DEAD/DEAH box helicase [Aquibacillus sp. LR5S19]MDL4842211.1 DEAD/DEAH box helicase [Aquibacillus sp. LR5S19]
MALRTLLSTDQIKPFLQKAWEVSGFTELTPIQEKAGPVIMGGEDVIAESPTGSGKTLAYLLPLLQEIDSNQKNIQVMILASSHELVMQIHQELQKWTIDSGIGSATLIGGANVKRQLEKLKKRPQIILGTPGRIQELLKSKKLKVHEVKKIVLDEADQLLVPEHINEVENIIKSTLRERQVLLFSATLSNSIEQKAATFMKEPQVIRINEQELDRPNVEHMYFVCDARDKIELLRKVLKADEKKALVFVRDIGNLSVMAEKLEYMGVSVGQLHGNTKKQEREKAIRDFKSGKSQLLLGTDVAARGLDIPDLTHVVHMDISSDATQYQHRSGRTGRLGSVGGTVISIITVAEERNLQKISRVLGLEIAKKKIYKGNIVDER